MKKIIGLDLIKVNNGAHRMFMESVAKILAEYEQAIAAHPKTKMLTAEFGKLLQQEKACMGLSRTSLRTAQIAEADHERDMLGLYVSDHPLSGMERTLERAADTTIVRLVNDEDGPRDGGSVALAGLITSVQPRVSKKNGKLWATIMLEDLTGSVEINFFPATYQTVSTMLAQDAVAVVTCRVQYRDGSLQLSAQSMTLPQADIPDAPVDIQLPERMCTADLMSSLAAVLSLYPGAAPVRLHVHRPGLTSVVQVAEEYYVSRGDGLFSDLRVLLGRNCLRA